MVASAINQTPFLVFLIITPLNFYYIHRRRKFKGTYGCVVMSEDGLQETIRRKGIIQGFSFSYEFLRRDKDRLS